MNRAIASLTRAALLLLLPLSAASCVVLVPFIESDYVPPKEEVYSAEGYGPTRERVRPRSRGNRYARLVRNLQSTDAVVRTHAATDLGAMGPDAIGALDALVQMLERDESKWARRAAAKALAKIGSKRAIEPLRRATKDSDRWVAHSAKRALQQLSSS